MSVSSTGVDEPSVMEHDVDDGNHNLRWASVDAIEKQNLFNSDVLEYLHAMSDDVFNHQDVCYHIRSFIEEEVAMDPDSFDTVDEDQLEEALSYLAYTDEVAKLAVKSVPKSILLTQNASYWATQFLENSVMCDQNSTYSYNDTCQDCWFDRTVTTWRHQVEGNAVSQEMRLRTYNVKQHPLEMVDFLDTKNESSKYFFHGTSRESADDIILNGISLRKGEMSKDFSSEHGFYMSEDFESCKDWANNKPYPAVVVFKIPFNFLEDRQKHLSLRSTDPLLERVVRYNRSDFREERDLKSEIKDYLTITGPMLLNPGPFKKGESPGFGALQTCILDQQFACDFHYYIDGVIYYEGNPTLCRYVNRR